jgi:CO/xanthine dehydrogenase Mo-binding subunit
MDLPEIVPIIVEAGHPEGPFGAKGVGEPAAAPAAPAIANAVFDAIGVRIKELPLTPEKIRAALKKKLGDIRLYGGDRICRSGIPKV